MKSMQSKTSSPVVRTEAELESRLTSALNTAFPNIPRENFIEQRHFTVRLPALHLLERLFTRNEYFIQSKLPLHEAIVKQTGKSPEIRKQFLESQWNAAKRRLFHVWEPLAEGEAIL